MEVDVKLCECVRLAACGLSRDWFLFIAGGFMTWACICPGCVLALRFALSVRLCVSLLSLVQVLLDLRVLLVAFDWTLWPVNSALGLQPLSMVEEGVMDRVIGWIAQDLG